MLTTFDRASAHAPSSVSRLRLRSAVLAWMAALALAGCGGGGDDTTQTDTTTDSGAEASVERAGPSGHWIIDQDYNGFRLIYDCTDRTALHYRYTLQADTGSAARPSTFTFDPTLPAGCLQGTSRNLPCSPEPGLRLHKSSAGEQLMSAARRCPHRRGTPRRVFPPHAGCADAPALLTSHTSRRAL